MIFASSRYSLSMKCKVEIHEIGCRHNWAVVT